MKTVVKIRQRDDGERHTMFVDGKEMLRVGSLCECPEDAIIRRDLVDYCMVAEVMEGAYKAAQRGEEFVYGVEEVEE